MAGEPSMAPLVRSVKVTVPVGMPPKAVATWPVNSVAWL